MSSQMRREAAGGRVFRRVRRRVVVVAALVVVPFVAQVGVAIPAAAADTSPPSTPTGVTASVSASHVTLIWTASTDNVAVDSYEIYRWGTPTFDPTDWTPNDIVDGTETSYVDEFVPQGTWYYRIIAVDAAGNPSAASPEVSAQVDEPTDVWPPTRPMNVVTSVSGSTVTLSWTPSTDDVGVIGYAIYTSTDPSRLPLEWAHDLLDFVEDPAYVDVGVPPGTWYYRIVAYDGPGNRSGGSEPTSAVVPDVTPPSTPAVSGHNVVGGAVTLAWDPSTDDVGVAGYDVHRSSASGFAPSVSTRTGSTTTNAFTDSPVASGTWYYRVVARDAVGNASAPSAQLAVTVGTPPLPPTSLVAVPGDGSATLSWAHSANRSSPLEPEYVVTLQPGGRQFTVHSASLTVNGLADGTYTFTVYARNGAGRSADVTSGPFTLGDTVAPSATKLMFFQDPESVGVGWARPPDADFAGVIVRRLEGLVPPNPGEGVEVYRGAAQGFADTTVLPGRTYTYTVWFHDEVPNYSSATGTLYGSILAATVSANRVAYGAAVTHRAKLTQAATGVSLPPSIVSLSLRPAGATTWAYPCSPSTVSGTASCVTRPAKNTTYQWHFSGGGHHGRASSRVYTVSVAPRVTAKVSVATVAPGGRFRLSGSVAPRHAGQRVYLQRFSAGAWRNIARTTLSSTSTYSFRVTPAATYSYRVRKPADADHSWGVSPTRRVKVG